MTVAEACELINRFRGNTATVTLTTHSITTGHPDLVGRLQTSGRIVEARASTPHLFEVRLAGVVDQHRLVLRTRNRELVWYADSQKLVITERTEAKIEVAAELVFGAHGGGAVEVGLTVSN